MPAAMRSSQISLKRTLLLSAFFAASLIPSGVLAQQDDDSSSSAPAQTTPRTPTPAASSSQESSARSTATTSRTSNAVITPTATGSSSETAPPAPTISSPPNTQTDDGPVGGLPTLTRTRYDAIPTYPPPAVPPTQNAPFMNHSTLPEGTVFIVVGAILGAFGLALLAWRGIVACLLHRSVERAAMAQHITNDKASFPAPPAPFYKYTDQHSSPSLGPAAGAGIGVRRSTRGPTPSATPSQTNLFFSPTAAPGGGPSATGMSSVSNRDSSYRESRFLPSGFYASATPNPGHAHQSSSISMSNLRPVSRGYPGGGANPMGPSPPESPDVGPRTTASRNFSSSSVNLNRPPSGRAPSAFLDDLLDENPGQFPPSQYGNEHRRSSPRY